MQLHPLSPSTESSLTASERICTFFEAATYTYFEARRTPVDELYVTLGFDDANSGVDVFRNDVTTVQQTARHVLA